MIIYQVFSRSIYYIKIQPFSQTIIHPFEETIKQLTESVGV